jgi:hypothetical protein
MSLRRWLQLGYQLRAMFFATTLVLADALAWMSWQLIRQEGAPAGQRLLERRENAADLTVAARRAHAPGWPHDLVKTCATSPKPGRESAGPGTRPRPGG